MAEEPVSRVEIAQRFKIAQSWWVASELARRNPHLFIHEWHPGGGGYDCLGLVDDRAPTDGIVLDLNRAGSLHVLKPEEATVAAWWELAASEDAHLIVKRIEQAAGLAPTKRPQTTDRSLSYRVIAQALATAVNDRHTWDARSLFHDTSGDWDEDAEREAWVSSFPTALAMTRHGALPGIGWHGEPWSQLWALTKDSEPVAILDVLGTVHRHDGERVELMPIYKAESGSIAATTSRALRGLLP